MADGSASKEGRDIGSCSSPISIIASPCNVDVSVLVGDTGVCGDFSLIKVSPVMVRDGAILAGCEAARDGKREQPGSSSKPKDQHNAREDSNENAL